MQLRALVEPAIVAGLACLAWRGRRRNPWRRVGGSAMFLEGGRIKKGPGALEGIHVGDLTRYGRMKRKIEHRRDRELERASRRARRAGGRYTRKAQAIGALLDADPELDGFLDRAEHGIDALEEQFEKRFPSGRPFRAALRWAIPGRGRYADLVRSPRFRAWKEAAESSYDWHGGALRVPPEWFGGERAEESQAQIEHAADAQLEDLRDRAITGRLKRPRRREREPGEDDDAPARRRRASKVISAETPF
jgi:hypothetical protein